MCSRQVGTVPSRCRPLCSSLHPHDRTYLQGLQGYGSIEYLDEYPRQSQGDKTRTIEILKDFYKYYEEKTGNRVVSSLETVTPIDNPLERRLKIAEYLHEMHSREEIQDHFCIKESTLRKDLQALLGGIEVFGSKIQIVECENRKKKKNHYYLCNVFPVFHLVFCFLRISFNVIFFY